MQHIVYWCLYLDEFAPYFIIIKPLKISYWHSKLSPSWRETGFHLFEQWEPTRAVSVVRQRQFLARVLSRQQWNWLWPRPCTQFLYSLRLYWVMRLFLQSSTIQCDQSVSYGLHYYQHISGAWSTTATAVHTQDTILSTNACHSNHLTCHLPTESHIAMMHLHPWRAHSTDCPMVSHQSISYSEAFLLLCTIQQTFYNHRFKAYSKDMAIQCNKCQHQKLPGLG